LNTCMKEKDIGTFQVIFCKALQLMIASSLNTRL
jgi:hypothetical protein